MAAFLRFTLVVRARMLKSPRNRWSSHARFGNLTLVVNKRSKDSRGDEEFACSPGETLSFFQFFFFKEEHETKTRHDNQKECRVFVRV